MTKNFCDKCKNEVPENIHIRISINGNTTKEKLMWKNLYLCESCYLKTNKKISSIFSSKVLEEAWTS